MKKWLFWLGVAGLLAYGVVRNIPEDDRIRAEHSDQNRLGSGVCIQWLTCSSITILLSAKIR